MEEKISKIKKEYLSKIQKASSLKELDGIFLELFGKSGEVSKLSKEFPGLSKEELKEVVPLFNRVKEELEGAVNSKREEVREKSYEELEGEKLDFKADSGGEEIAASHAPRNDGENQREGHMHPLSRFEAEIVELFKKIGFQQYEAPDIDTDDYNFGLLNIPSEHPARDLWDTLYIDSRGKGQGARGKLLLRTHTSNSQIRIMREFKPPIRMMVLGRCYRRENLDPRHEHTFDQFELVYVDRGLSMANLQYLSEYFLKSVLGEDVEVRMRPKYYPFVEPGVGIDGTCIFCKGNGCKVCAGIGWLELGGAGMIHPTVLRNAGINPDEYSGIAWGPGLERILMLKHGINDVRLFRSGDLKFLEKF